MSKVKIHMHIKSPLETFNVPHCRCDHIHVDLVGPLPPSDGLTHLLTIMDRFSRWPEAVPIYRCLCSGPHIPLDLTFWVSHGHVLRPGIPIYFTVMVIRCQVVRDHTSSYHGLPPTSQRSGGKIPSPSEDVPTRPSDRSSVGTRIALGTFEYLHRPKGGLRMLLSRIGLRSPRHGTWRIFPSSHFTT